jgi:hypothetical protein
VVVEARSLGQGVEERSAGQPAAGGVTGRRGQRGVGVARSAHPTGSWTHPLPRVSAGQALTRVCHTDLHVELLPYDDRQGTDRTVYLEAQEGKHVTRVVARPPSWVRVAKVGRPVIPSSG